MSFEWRFNAIANDGELYDRRQASLAGLRELKTVAPVAKPQTVAPELLTYLLLIQAHPHMPATQRDKLAGIPMARGSRLRARLLELGFAEELMANPGTHGSAYKDLRVTQAGLTALETKR
jgi:hypothetical protein